MRRRWPFGQPWGQQRRPAQRQALASQRGVKSAGRIELKCSMRGATRQPCAASQCSQDNQGWAGLSKVSKVASASAASWLSAAGPCWGSHHNRFRQTAAARRPARRRRRRSGWPGPPGGARLALAVVGQQAHVQLRVRGLPVASHGNNQPQANHANAGADGDLPGGVVAQPRHPSCQARAGAKLRR